MFRQNQNTDVHCELDKQQIHQLDLGSLGVDWNMATSFIIRGLGPIALAHSQPFS
jgi:hypothetical protein